MPGLILEEAAGLIRAPSTGRHTPGLFNLIGMRVKGTRKPIGVATLVRYTNNRKWFGGSALYKLDPPIQIFEYGTMTEAEYVIVAHVPSIAGRPQMTTIFAASGTGSLFGRFSAMNDHACAEVGPRLVGRLDHKRVLSALQGGYGIDATMAKPRPRVDRSRKLGDK